jgi:hypothetical protein
LLHLLLLLCSLHEPSGIDVPICLRISVLLYTSLTCRESENCLCVLCASVWVCVCVHAWPRPGGDQGDAGGVDPDEPDEGPGDAPDAQSAEEEEAEELEGGDVARFVRELARETPARRREMVEELREDYPKLATIVDHALVQADALAKEEEDDEEEEDEDEL